MKATTRARPYNSQRTRDRRNLGQSPALPATEKIPFSELERRLRDINVPDRELRPYLTGDPSASGAFAPVVQVDQSRVELDDMDRFRVEGAFAMNWANGICRWRRQTKFKARRLLGERLPVIVAEGDSWFEFPFLLDDVVDQFDAAYHIWDVSAAGDTLMNMVNDAPEYIEAIAQQEEVPKVFMFSGAGNDFVGEEPDGTSVVFRVLRDFEPGRPASWYLETNAFAERVAFIERGYRTLLGAVEREFRSRVSTVMHGYDHAIPATPGDPRRPSWAKVDQWLGAPLTQRGITDPALQRQIIRLMIDRLNEVQRRLCGGNVGGGAFKTAFHVDIRNTLGSVAEWADELHPTDAGFGKVAQRFAPVLTDLLGREEAVMAPSRGYRPALRADERDAAPEPEDAASAYKLGLIELDGDERVVRRDGEADMHESEAQAGFDQVPFIGDQESDEPFSDIAEAAVVDDPNSMLRGFQLQLEAQVGEWNTVQSALLQALAEGRRSVARIAVPAGDYDDYLGRPAASGWHGTGFLVEKNLLLTNHHVFNSIAVATAASVEFDYEASKDDLLTGITDLKPATKRFKVDPQRLFVTSPATQTGLDYTFVWIDEAASNEFGFLAMERASFTAEKFDPVFVIHHPRGRLKEASLDDTEVLRMQSTVIHYAADTDKGSSGAPVFDKRGRLIALHHARNTDGKERLQDGGVTDVLNEGIKIAAIAVDLENRMRRGGNDAGMAETVLGCMRGSDTLTGFFGALGRDTKRESDVEAVVDAYKGTEQDVDIGFWNIEWLANRYEDEAKLKGAATVIADLNLDIWGLVEVSPPAVKALVSALQDQFGERYEYAFSEPDAPESRQSTAVIWKPRTVSGKRIEWPEPISRWWNLDSRDDMPFEAVEGKIFNRYPGLFKFKALDRGKRQPFDFFMVPLHLKAMAEGGKRRRLASMLLARAVQEMIAKGEDADWVIGGDVNDELGSGDFTALTDGGFLPMSAADEKAGAFTYLKAPKSLIDNIFLSPQATAYGGADYFIVAKERSLDKFVRQVSDHRPIVLRVSLAEPRGTGQVSDADLRRMVDMITAERKGTASARRRR
jgi:hypothetical protein